MQSYRCLAVLPRYEQWVGNVCECYGVDGEIEPEKRTVKTQMRRYFREHAIDEREYKKWVHELIGLKKSIPLAYSADLVFLPVRTRIPNVKNDGAHAYVRLNAIFKLEDYRVILKSGHHIECLQNIESLRNAIRRARTVERFLRVEDSKRKAEQDLIALKLSDGRQFAAMSVVAGEAVKKDSET